MNFNEFFTLIIKFSYNTMPRAQDYPLKLRTRRYCLSKTFQETAQCLIVIYKTTTKPNDTMGMRVLALRTFH